MSSINASQVLETKPVGKLLLQYSIPAIIGMTVTSLYNIIDSVFIGHGVGLQINELPVLTPRSQEVLEPGMVFALEPKFVIAGTGAVGIENTLLVTDSGVEKLTVFEEGIIPLM